MFKKKKKKKNIYIYIYLTFTQFGEYCVAEYTVCTTPLGNLRVEQGTVCNNVNNDTRITVEGKWILIGRSKVATSIL